MINKYVYKQISEAIAALEITLKSGQCIIDTNPLVGHQDIDRSHQELVYIPIYCANGSDLDSWPLIINSLVGRVVTRPVYKNENDVVAFITSRPLAANEGYVSIYVDTEDISVPLDVSMTKDAMGHELLSIKDRCIKSVNIYEFMHQQQRYHVEYNKLVKQS